jgi:hypothetical protein
MNGESPLKQLPVFISLTKPGRTGRLSKGTRPNGIPERVLESIASTTGVTGPQAKKMITRGKLFLILDDLDYLHKDEHLEVEQFISRARRNSFMCILTERPRSYGFLEDFDLIRIPEWKEEDVKDYISRRIKDAGGRTELIQKLADLEILQRRLTPLEVKCLIDSLRETPAVKFDLLAGPEGSIEPQVLSSYLLVVLRKANIAYTKAIQGVGHLSLTLLTQGLSYFLRGSGPFEGAFLDRLTPALLKREGGLYTFAHGNYQLLLAAKYVSDYWPEARSQIATSRISSTMAHALYEYARQSIPPSHEDDLYRTFAKLWGEPISPDKERAGRPRPARLAKGLVLGVSSICAGAFFTAFANVIMKPTKFPTGLLASFTLSILLFELWLVTARIIRKPSGRP